MRMLLGFTLYNEIFSLNMKTKWECQNKKRYETKDKAMRQIHRMNEESFGGHTFLKPYRCKFCHGYHLTSRD